MSNFTSPLTVMVLEREWDGRGLVKLLEPLIYHVGHVDSEDIIVVPSGFISDLISAPAFARTWISPLDRAAKAGVLHDWLLYEGKRSKSDADLIFLEALKVLQVPAWKRLIMYWAVKYWPWAKKVEQPHEGYQSS